MFTIGLKTLRPYLGVLCVYPIVWGLIPCLAIAQSTTPISQNTPTTIPTTTTTPTTTAVDPQPALPQGETPLTLDAITALKTQTASSDKIDEPTKAQLQGLYDQILVQIKFLKENQDNRQNYDQYRTNAPAELEKIKAALAQPPTPLSDLPGADASLDVIQQALTEANLTLEKVKANADEKEQEPKRRSERRTQIPEKISTHKQTIAAMDEQLRTQAKTTQVDQARDLLARATRQASNARIDMITSELLYFDASTDLLAAQRDLATRDLDTAKKRVTALQDRLNVQRKAEAEKIRQQAAVVTQQTEQDHPVIQKVALQNTELAQKQKDLTDLLQKTTERDQKIKQQVVRLGQDMAAAKERLIMAKGVTHVTRTLLRSERNKLNQLYNVQANRRAIKERVSKITDTQLDIYQYDQDWTQLGDTELAIRDKNLLTDPEQPIPKDQREAIVAKLTELLQNQRTIVRRIADLSQSYSDALLSLDVSERQLVEEIHKYQAFIDENVLWVRVGSLSDFMNPHSLWTALVWLVSPVQWQEVVTLLRADLIAQPEIYVLVILCLALALLLHRRIIHHIKRLTKKTRHTYTDRFFHTLVVIALTLLLSLIWASTIRFVGWRLDLGTSNNEFVRVLGGALSVLAFQAFVLLFLYWLLLPDGLALQLGLTDASRAFFRRHLVWFMMVSLPLTLTGYLLQEQQLNEIWAGGIGRLLLVLNLSASTLLTYVLLHPSNPAFTPFLEKHRNNWIGRVHPLWRGLTTLIPAGFTVLALFGYAYAARHLYQKLLAVTLLAVGCSLLSALLIRWLEITQKQSIFRLRLKSRIKKAGKGSSLLDDPHPEQAIQSISDQTRRLIHALAVLVLLIGIWWIFQSILPAMNVIQDHGLWPTTNLDANQDPIFITVGNVVGAFLAVVITVIVTKNVPGLLEITVLRNLPLDRGARFAISTLCRYALAIIGIILAFTKIGIGWSKVQWLVAAMTVGLGFGLQEIFANFISGLIILFEQPIRVDDVVTVEDVTGVVTQIKIRATTIRKWDRRELIVPNKEFITNRLVNWTLSDNVMRIEFPVGIAYGSDTVMAEKTLYEVAHADPDVLKDPPARVVFKGFGDSCLDFELRIYFDMGIDTYLPLWHRINMAIDKAFRVAHIEIAFPQRDLHVRSSDIPLPFGTE